MARVAQAGVPLPGDLQLPDRYQVRRHVAHGGMASVWCAHDRALGRDVAVKLLAEQFAHNQDAIRRFKREALAAARLSGHPHVVTIYDVGEAIEPEDQGRRAFIVMEYLAGGTVADALRVGAVSREESLRWLYEAAAALDYAHGQGVVHRDIKPANLLLDCPRVLHVADFGIARLGTEDTITGTGHMLGTAAYMAPECALGHPATEATDRYALAVVAFELLTGERPFTAEHFAAQARLHVEEPAPRASSRNPEIPRAADAVLRRGMSKQPEHRWPTATALVDTLDLALTEKAGRSFRRAAAVAPSAAAVPSAAAAPVPAAAPDAGAAPEAAASPAARVARRSPRRPVRAASPPPLQFMGGSSWPRVPRWGAAAAALAATAFATGLAIGANHSSAPSHAPVASAPKAQVHHHTHHAAAHPRATNKRHTPGPATTSATGTPAAATTPPPTADTLEARGHQLMLAGNYSSAIPILRQAVATSDPSSLNYAYALFDLGHSLLASGDPRGAIPILYKRLQIPNQTGVVRAELQAALQAVGSQVGTNGGGTPAGPPGIGDGGPGKHKRGGGN